MKQFLAVLIAVSGTVAHLMADDYARVYIIEGDLASKEQASFSLPLVAGTTPMIQYRIKKNGLPFTQTTGWTGVLWFAESATSDMGMAITNSALTGGRAEFHLSIHETAVPGSYFSQFMFYGPGGKVEEWHRGTLTIQNGGITGPWTPFNWNFTNTWSAQESIERIDERIGAAQIYGDVTGPLSNSVIAKIQGRPVSASTPGSGQALVWSGAAWVPATVSTGGGGGSQSSDLILIEGTQTAAAVATNKVGIYRKQLPAGHYGMILNVAGQEIGFVDHNGLSLYVGSLQLFLAELEANIAAYDGAQAAPSITWGDDRTLGWYRSQVAGVYSYCAADDNTTPWWWSRLGVTVADGDKLRQDARLRTNSRDVQRTETFASGWTQVLAGKWMTLGQDEVYGSVSGGYANIGTNGSVMLRATYPIAGYEISGAITNVDLTVTGYRSGVWDTLGNGLSMSLTNAVYTRIKVQASPQTIPTPGTPTYACLIDTLTVRRWAYTSVVATVQDTAGSVVRVDPPIDTRDVANRAYVDAAAAQAEASAAAAWSTQPATSDVNLDGNRLYLDSKWSLVGSGAWSALSYDGSVSTGIETNQMRLEINGAVVWAATLGYSLTTINSLTLSNGGTNVSMMVSTNGVSSDPWPEYATLVTGPWTRVPSYTEGWTLGMATNQFAVSFVNPIVGSGTGFFRVCYTTPGSVDKATFYVPTQAPRFVFPAGDYLIGTGNNLYYVTSGGATNAVWP